MIYCMKIKKQLIQGGSWKLFHKECNIWIDLFWIRVVEIECRIEWFLGKWWVFQKDWSVLWCRIELRVVHAPHNKMILLKHLQFSCYYHSTSINQTDQTPILEQSNCQDVDLIQMCLLWCKYLTYLKKGKYKKWQISY